MREMDRIELEPANHPPQRFHRGRLGQVLERFLKETLKKTSKSGEIPA